MTSTADLPASTDALPPTGDRLSGSDLLVIGLLLASTFVVILNETIMSVALPELTSDLQVTTAAAQWLTTGFLLTMAVLIPVTGFLLQRFHLRPLFLTAMTLFSAGTLVAATAPGFEVLLAGRVVQASGTAIMIPLLFTTVLNLVPAARRGRMMGNISIVIAVAPAIGPTLSGLILDVLDWRWMFWLVLPISLLSLSVGAVKLRNVTEPRSVPIDLVSVALSALAFGGLIYGLSSIGEAASGEVPVDPWITITVGALALAAFVSRQLVLQRSDRALLDLRTFRSSHFSIAVLLVAASMMSLFGTLILIPIYLQGVLGLDTLDTGLLLLPGGLLMGLMGPIVGRIYDGIGPRALVITGSVIVSAALWMLAQVDTATPSSYVLTSHVILSLGLALLFTPLFSSGLGALAPALYSHGSAIVSTVQQLAGAAGTALFITILARAAADTDSVAATSDGVRAAFVVGAVISTVAVAIALFVRRPAEQASAGPVEG
ncbi:DHA2 family efflux MFS transporter permease subunit [Nocardioides sp. cx-173]|uniref:DHA2 family efflux MFS transporter permease subunit n=1 Tax=Nocardioides sp. cx-173 TaxID=2898796 RepID=UPI001E349A84|nr:DHA2 family efflux MFS transporter permease subunit [Nocardioides sp. cx-173]MCD4525209.1 DHA2 family efflux MFS transporter permease subunit [Nocardioides sp. cx-173]UGB40988.1 DHA2 family efflux MFS transporter permease subunit [Nocardioides sp. cx-173]